MAPPSCIQRSSFPFESKRFPPFRFISPQCADNMVAFITNSAFRNSARRVSRHTIANLLNKQHASEVFRPQIARFSSKAMKVSVLGACSQTGACLSLLLKQSFLIDELAIFDEKRTYGLALDLNCIDTRCKVSTCTSSERGLAKILGGSKIVMIVADRVVKENVNQWDILKYNAEKLSDLLPNVIKYCPQAMVGVAMNPVNSLIPLAIEMYKTAGIYDHNRIFGVTSLDCLRANAFAAEVIGVEPECTIVPVIGGSCPRTCIPVFSQTKPCNKMSQIEARRLTDAVRSSNDEIYMASYGKEKSSFAQAFGAARFCVSLCKALRQQRNVTECAYVRSCVLPEVTYFAAPLELGPNGIQKHLGIPALNEHERRLLEDAVPFLKTAITVGEVLALGDENNSSEMWLRHTEHRDPAQPPRTSSS